MGGRDGAIIFSDPWRPVRSVRRVVQGGTPANRGTDTMGRPGGWYADAYTASARGMPGMNDRWMTRTVY
jgi:hypothetical protein